MNKILIAIVALIIAAGGYLALTGASSNSLPVAPDQVAPVAAPVSEAAVPAPTPAPETSQAVPAAPTSGTPGGTTASASAGITMADVAKHGTKDDCWVVISGKVYDVTAGISQHPGGEKAIISQCGKDGTQVFMGQDKHAQVGALKALAGALKGDVAN